MKITDHIRPQASTRSSTASTAPLSPHDHLITIGDIRDPKEPGIHHEYCGRKMNRHQASVLANPLPVPGKFWSNDAINWTAWLLEHGDRKIQASAQIAQKQQGWIDGVSSGAYEIVLREQIKSPDSPQLALIHKLAAMLLSMHPIKLLCWCRGNKGCHTNVVRSLILEEAQKILAMSQTSQETHADQTIQELNMSQSYSQQLAHWLLNQHTRAPSLPWQKMDATPQNDQECLVFSSNLDGFHGAGSAGLAMRGDAGNNWRSDTDFMALVKQYQAQPRDKRKPIRGNWFAEIGNAMGPQIGKRGKSYAIPTVTRPGAAQSIPALRAEVEDTRYSIQKGIEIFLRFATSRPGITFKIPRMGVGYAGHSQEAIDQAWALALKARGLTDLPDNLIFCDRPNSLATENGKARTS